MKFACLSLGLLLATSAAWPALARPQPEMNAAAAADFAAADQELNRVYGEVMGVLDEESRERLKIAQRAWVAFRDAEAMFRADAGARGGSMWPQLHENVRARLTAARVEDLRGLLLDDED